MNSKSIAQKLSGASVALVLGLIVNPESAKAVNSPNTGERLLRPTLLINNSEDATVLTENFVSEGENINSSNPSAEESWTTESSSVSNTPLPLPQMKAELPQNSPPSGSVFIADNRINSGDSFFTEAFVVASGDALLPTESVISQTPTASIPVKVQLPNNSVQPQLISIPVSVDNTDINQTASVTIPVLPPSQGVDNRTTENPNFVSVPVNLAVNKENSEPVLISNNPSGNGTEYGVSQNIPVIISAVEETNSEVTENLPSQNNTIIKPLVRELSNEGTENLLSQNNGIINPLVRELNSEGTENAVSQNVRTINPPAREPNSEGTENLVAQNVRIINPPARKENNNSNNPNLVSAIPIQVEHFDPTSRPSAREMGFPDLPQVNSPARYLPENQRAAAGFIWPARGVFTSGFGMRWGRMHRGIDIAGPVGTPVVAAAPGEVITAGWNSGGFGNLVRIRHADGSVTLYAHNSRIKVRRGEFVNQGQLIAKMGSTGFSTGSHLHFEIHPDGSRAVNPLPFLPPR